MAEEIRLAQPKEYYRAFLEKEVRPDDRELGEFRPTVLNIGCVSTAEGSSLVKLGNTTVMCGIKAEVAEPRYGRPTEGYIVPNVELSPLSSPNFRPGPPPEQAQVLSQNMVDFLDTSQCIKLDSLCISSGKLVWVLYIDLVCLDYDGNVMDACTLALMAALKNTSLPVVTVDEDTGDVKTHLSTHSSLSVDSCPVSTTFIVFDNTVLLVDPTREEELLATGAVTVVTEGDNLCSVYKPGGSPLTDEQVEMCVERAFVRGKEATALITDTLCSIDR
ncbi:exosome complex component RRP43 [Aplysia californica]|uniref:Ribosomal RNA-processing protein 43 n=1 Tax=Aplysia californica TaxID=6500 RepID=A0ABM0JCV2_APLCA|nr:exosome complex component RRP43 [Aplysia californica]